jgi:hypothetical protein
MAVTGAPEPLSAFRTPWSGSAQLAQRADLGLLDYVWAIAPSTGVRAPCIRPCGRERRVATAVNMINIIYLYESMPKRDR